MVEADLDFAGWATTSVTAGEQVCIMPHGHPLTRKTVLSPADFEGVDFIYFSAEDMYRRNLDNIFRDHGVTRRLRMEVSTASTVCSLVAQGIGVSIINPISAMHYLNQGVEMRRLSFSVPYIVRLHKNEQSKQSARSQCLRRDLHRGDREHEAETRGKSRRQYANTLRHLNVNAWRQSAPGPVNFVT